MCFIELKIKHLNKREVQREESRDKKKLYIDQSILVQVEYSSLPYHQ